MPVSSAGGGLLDSLSHRGAEIVALLFESLGLGLPSITRPSQIPHLGTEGFDPFL